MVDWKSQGSEIRGKGSGKAEPRGRLRTGGGWLGQAEERSGLLTVTSGLAGAIGIRGLPGPSAAADEGPGAPSKWLGIGTETGATRQSHVVGVCGFPFRRIGTWARGGGSEL